MMRRIRPREHWIIEHAGYGALAEWDWSTYPYDPPMPRFTQSGYRTDGMIFWRQQDAEKALERCRQSKRKGMRGCYILHYTKEKGYVHI
jgi:hypothetical protein